MCPEGNGGQCVSSLMSDFVRKSFLGKFTKVRLTLMRQIPGCECFMLFSIVTHCTFQELELIQKNKMENHFDSCSHSSQWNRPTLLPS